jgi:hypothetical protein
MKKGICPETNSFFRLMQEGLEASPYISSANDNQKNEKHDDKGKPSAVSVSSSTAHLLHPLYPRPRVLYERDGCFEWANSIFVLN